MAVSDTDIRELIAAVARLPVAQIDDQTRLGDIGLGSSIAIAILRTRLKEDLQLTTGELTWKSRVADVGRGASASAAGAPTSLVVANMAQPAAPQALGLHVGVDLQDISALPEWPDPFYAAHFTPRELSRGRARSDWRAHFCGLWCAKEAARKASPVLAGVPFVALEIELDLVGRPHLLVLDGAIPRSIASISITHSAGAAAAVALATG